VLATVSDAKYKTFTGPRSQMATQESKTDFCPGDTAIDMEAPASLRSGASDETGLRSGSQNMSTGHRYPYDRPAFLIIMCI
jgi:hypothetical protein